MGNRSQAPKPQRGFYKTCLEPWRAVWACLGPFFISQSKRVLVEESLLLAYLAVGERQKVQKES